MSTAGLLTKPESAEAFGPGFEDAWDEAPSNGDVETRHPERRRRRKLARGYLVNVLSEALDQAVEGGEMTWAERDFAEEAITAGDRINEALAQELIDRWEENSGRLGSVEAAKADPLYKHLLSFDADSVLRAALRRLERAASPHTLVLLHEVAGSAPIAASATVSGAADAWLRWGRAQGLI